MMIVNDSVYGENKISDKLILELIKTKAMQRLKGINQYGTWHFFNPEMLTTRFDHSLGVYFLLRRFNAPKEEQVAGLIHDVNHGVFSHVIDYVHGQPERQEHHDEVKESMIMKTEIPEVLGRHDMDVEKVMDEKRIPLLERPLPDLCADRLDYFLRDSLLLNICSQEDIDFFLKHIVVYNNEFVMNSFEAASKIALAFLECSRIFYSPPVQALSYQILADAIKKGLDAGILKESDLWTEDELVMEKLRESNNNDILRNLNLLNPSLKIEEDEQNYDYLVQSKVRYIDPNVLTDGRLKRVSEKDKNLKQNLEDYKKRLEKGYHVRLCKEMPQM